MSGTKSRNKGATFERRIAAQLREWSGEEFRRTKFSDGPGTDTPDIITPPRFRPVIECKNCEGWSWDATIQGKGPVWEWWAQARRQAGDRPPWLVLTRNRQPVYLMVDMRMAISLESSHKGLGALAWVGDRAGRNPVFLLADVLEATDFEWWCV